MSFIYNNDKLLADLIKSAIDHEVKFNKHGQMAADPSVNRELRNYLTVSQKLAQQLKNTYFPPSPETGVVTTGTNKEAPLGVPDLASLGNFLDFIVNNQILVDGKRVAYNGSETNIDTREYLPVTAEQIKFMTETQNAQGEREQFQAEYYVSRALLEKYIISILKDTSKQDERAQQFIKVMLGARLQEINRIFRTKLTTDYKEPEKALDDGTKLDDIPNPTNKPGATVPLTVGDLRDIQKFWGWAINKGMSTLDDQGVVIQAGTQNFDQCEFINFIAARAKSRYSYRMENSQYYWTQIQAIAQEAGCDISQVSGQQSQQGQQGGQGGLQDPQVLQRLVGLLPFNSQDVNFREIKKFIDTYAPLARRSDITGMTKQVNDSIQLAQTLMRQPSMIVPLQQLKAPNDLSAYHAFAKDGRLADVLYTIVNTAGIIYKDFVNTARHVLGDDATLENRRQVDAGGPWSVNMSDINQFRTDIAEEGQHGRKLYL